VPARVHFAAAPDRALTWWSLQEEKRKAAQRKQIKEENRKKSLIVTEIKDTRKIKRMSKKQLK
jgi:hypothetical protein